MKTMNANLQSSARSLVFGALVSLVSAVSCTAVVATDATQCSVDADCAARGPDFEGSVCAADGYCTEPPAPAPECTKNSDCKGKGAGLVCSSRVQKCLPVETEDCKVVYGDATADGTVLFGLLSEVGAADSLYFRQGQHARAAQLAFREFFEKSAVKLPGNRTAALVACSEYFPRRASAQLANVGVTAVIGPAEEQRQRAVVETLASVGIPTFSPWINGNPSAVLPNSNGLAWVTSFLRPEIIAPVNAVLAEQEQRVRAELGVTSVRVAVVMNAGPEATNPFLEFATLTDQRLVFNGRTAIENGKDAGCNNCFRRFETNQSLPDVVNARALEIATFAPHIIIPFTDIDWGAQLLPAIEKLYESKAAAERPIYIHPFIQFEEQGYKTLDFTKPDIRRRVTGVRQVRDNGFELFQDKFREGFRPPSDPSKLGPQPNRGAGGAFETALLLLFASYAALTDDPVLAPSDLTEALKRVTNVQSPTKITLNDIPAGIQRLNAKEPIRFTGLFTDFDFDYTTSAAKPRWTTWCLSETGQLVSNGRAFANGAFEPKTSCQ